MKDDAKHLRISERKWFAVILVTLLSFFTVAWPLRNMALVIWVRGSAAYSDGLRVLGGKPSRFSDGQLVPSLPNFITGMIAFVVAVFAAQAIVWILFRVYEKICSR